MDTQNQELPEPHSLFHHIRARNSFLCGLADWLLEEKPHYSEYEFSNSGVIVPETEYKARIDSIIESTVFGAAAGVTLLMLYTAYLNSQ